MILSGDTSGQVTVTVPAVAGTNTITLPAATGTVMVSGNAPAFSAYATTNQSVSVSTNTKVTFDVEDFDTNNNFASSRFTPTVAGYYQINLIVRANSSTANTVQAFIYKSGSLYQYSQAACDPGAYGSAMISQVVYLNGTTDYIEGWGYVNGIASATFNSASNNPYGCRMSGSLVRTA
jgi:hypothetical protein